MKTYEVKIYKEGQHVDTQVVKAIREGLAITAAMAPPKVLFRGAKAGYEVKEPA
jgi:acyl-CoA thioesterase